MSDHISYRDVFRLSRKLDEPERSQAIQALEQIESTPEGQELFSRLQDVLDRKPILTSGFTNSAYMDSRGRPTVTLNDGMLRNMNTLAYPRGVSEVPENIQELNLTYPRMMFHEFHHLLQDPVANQAFLDRTMIKWRMDMPDDVRQFFTENGYVTSEDFFRLSQSPEEATRLFAGPEGGIERQALALLVNYELSISSSHIETDVIDITNEWAEKYLGEPHRAFHSGVFDSRDASRQVNAPETSRDEIANISLEDQRLFSTLLAAPNRHGLDHDGDGLVNVSDIDRNANGVFDYQDYMRLVDQVNAALPEGAEHIQYAAYESNEALLGDLSEVLTHLAQQNEDPELNR